MISVLVPSFNRTTWLVDCLDSILGQTYQDFEIIVVDDGSDEPTKAILEHYSKNPKIKVIFNKHKGTTHTKNTGIKESRGEYIAMIDDDDKMVAERLENSLKTIKGVDIVYSDYYSCDYKDNIFGEGKYKDVNKLSLEEVRENQNVPQVTIMAKRECFERFPYREIDDLDDDHYVIYQMFKHGYKFKKMKEPVTIKRYHKNNHYRLHTDRYKKRSEEL